MKAAFLALFLLPVLALYKEPQDREEIFIVSCTVSWYDVEGAVRAKHIPYRAFRTEGGAELEVKLLNREKNSPRSLCDYSYVLLENLR